MKRLMIMLVVMMLLNTVILAQESQNYVITDFGINIRSGPSGRYLVRRVVGYGKLAVTGRTDFNSSRVCTGIWRRDVDMWLRVDLEGIEGWVKYCVVDFVGDIDSLPVVEPSFPSQRVGVNSVGIPLDELGAVPNVAHIIADVKEKYTHLRSNPRLDGAIIDYVSAKQVYVTGISKDDAWVKVQYKAVLRSCLANNDDCGMEKVEGWIAKFLLKYPENWQDIIPVVEN